MNEEITKEKLNTWDYLRYLSRLDSAGLKSCGYSSMEHALSDTIKHSVKMVEKIVVKVEKQYPLR